MDTGACLALDAWLVAVSLAGAAVVVADKARARAGRRRVRERTLFLFGLLGSAGALLAMLVVRHKTAKPRFLLPFLGCLLVAVGWVVALRLRLAC